MHQDFEQSVYRTKIRCHLFKKIIKNLLMFKSEFRKQILNIPISLLNVVTVVKSAFSLAREPSFKNKTSMRYNFNPWQ